MIYKPITDEKGVKDAFVCLQNLFHKGNKEHSIHSKLDLVGDFYEGNLDRYIIKFGHVKGPKFMANVRPKSRDKDNSTGVSGLFVKDGKGCRFLTHNGNIVGPTKERKKNFLEFIGPGPQIKVQRNRNYRFVVARIDHISAFDFVGRINQVTQVVSNFKKGVLKPLKLDCHSLLIEDELSEVARGGQGYGLSSKERKAVEDCAMKRAKKHYKNEGYQVEDTSRNHPYDLRCSKGKETIFIEVKGSTGSNDKISLTKNEADCANEKDRKFELFVVSKIEMDRDAETPKARGGKRRIIKPWKPKRKCLTPIKYSYDLARHGDP